MSAKSGTTAGLQSLSEVHSSDDKRAWMIWLLGDVCSIGDTLSETWLADNTDEAIRTPKESFM